MRQYAEATAEMLKLTHAGLPDWHDALAGPVIYRGEADEVKHWKIGACPATTSTPGHQVRRSNGARERQREG